MGLVEVVAVLLGGAPDPTIRLPANVTELSIDALPECAAASRVLGFSGWRLPSGAVVRGLAQLDAAIFAQPEYTALPASVRAHILDESRHLSTVGPCAVAPPATRVAAPECDGTIVGPDDAHLVHYDPSKDDKGCFATDAGQSNNNCYNYANDVVTNTFAQPGRGSGVCSHHDRPCVKNTCDAVKQAAVSDGLVWVGTTLPTELPPNGGHYVSLHIWPQSNFHWIRMDANLTWSHKPGGSPVRDHDNNGKVITDPGKADFSPWTEHCGYLRATPSKVTLY